jgi:signal transduction histidine kinase
MDRLRGLDPARADAFLAAALLVLAQAEVWLTPATAGQRPETAVAAAVMTGALAFRRSHPLFAALVMTGAFTGLALVSGLPNAVFMLPCGLLAMYSLGAYAAPEGSVVGLAATLAALPLGAMRVDDPTITDLTAPVVLFSAAWAGGRAMGTRRRRDAELEDQHVQLVRQQGEREAEAVAQERRRIARELHDIVAHRVTTIVIQAESGTATVGDDDLSRRTFARIARSGRQSLDELRILLGLLRDGDSPPRTSPPPGAMRLDDLLPMCAGRDCVSRRRSRATSGACPPGST